MLVEYGIPLEWFKIVLDVLNLLRVRPIRGSQRMSDLFGSELLLVLLLAYVYWHVCALRRRLRRSGCVEVGDGESSVGVFYLVDSIIVWGLSLHVFIRYYIFIVND